MTLAGRETKRGRATRKAHGSRSRARRPAARRPATRARRSVSARRPAAVRRPAKARPARPAKVQAGPPTVLYRVCKPGWAVLTEKIPSAPHTRFVCPFCPRSHRVPGPVRGFLRVRRPQWLKLHQVFE